MGNAGTMAMPYRDTAELFGTKDRNRTEEGALQDLRRYLSEGNVREISRCLSSFGRPGHFRSTLRAQDTKTVSRFYLKYYILLIKEAMHAGLMLEDIEEQGISVVHFCDLPDNESRLAFVLNGTEALLGAVRRKSGGQENEHILRAKEYIARKIGDPELDLNAVSDHVGLSRIYFCKLFHETEGVTFNTYLRDLRISEAKRLLSQGVMKVVEVSRACGYANANYFGYVFKREVGMTPLEFQRRYAGRTEEAGA